MVRSDGRTILGADDKAAVATLLIVARDLVQEPPAADVEIVITPGEEIGLQGAKALDLSLLKAGAVFVLDSEGAPGTIIASAPTLKAVDAVFTGVAAHAGMAPEQGRSAVVAAARAVAMMQLGRIDDETTANVGVVKGGVAVNVVPERCEVRAETRSRDLTKVTAQVEAMIAALNLAAAEVGVDVDVDVHEDFRGYAHDPESPVMRPRLRRCALMPGWSRAPSAAAAARTATSSTCEACPPSRSASASSTCTRLRSACRSTRLEQLYELAHALVRAAGARHQTE